MSRHRSRLYLTDDPERYLDIFDSRVTGPDAVTFWDVTEGPAPRSPIDECDRQWHEALNVVDNLWRWIRDGRCLAARPDGSRCSRDACGMPFCWQHEGAAIEYYDRQRIEVGRKLATVPDAKQLVTEARDVLLRHGPGEVVYFYELAGQGVVKIGTTRRLEIRLASFRAGKGCAFPEGADHTTGRLIGTTPGGRDLEQYLHRVHHSARVRGEWFRLTDEVADHIGRLVPTSP